MAQRFESERRADAVARKEGVIAGLLGAIVVAVFYLIIDISRGIPLLTPSVLGQVLLFRQAAPVTDHVITSAVIAFTVVHFVAFTAMGLVLSGIARRAETSSLARYAIVPVVLAMEIFAFGMLFVLDSQTRGMFPAWTALGSNTIAALVMMYWLWRHRPALREAAARNDLGSLDGESTAAP